MDSIDLAELAAEACDDRKAKNIQLIDITEVSSLCEWLVITEGLSDLQVRAIIKSVEDKLKDVAKRLPLRKEGIDDAKWSLLDYGEVIIHVFQPSLRKFYELEAFWSNGKTRKYSPTSNTNLLL